MVYLRSPIHAFSVYGRPTSASSKSPCIVLVLLGGPPTEIGLSQFSERGRSPLGHPTQIGSCCNIWATSQRLPALDFCICSTVTVDINRYLASSPKAPEQPDQVVDPGVSSLQLRPQMNYLVWISWKVNVLRLELMKFQVH